MQPCSKKTVGKAERKAAARRAEAIRAQSTKRGLSENMLYRMVAVHRTGIGEGKEEPREVKEKKAAAMQTR